MLKHTLHQAEDAGGESDVLDTPRIKRIIKSDPVYTQIVDDSFFDNPLEVSEQDDVISMRSEDMEEVERVKMGGQNGSKVTSNVDGNNEQPVSQGSDPKWDECARKIREKKKKEDEERLRKEEEKTKKKQGRGWFMKNRKDPKDKGDNNFVKKKELEDLADATMSSTNTLTNTSSNTLSETPSTRNTSSSHTAPSKPDTAPNQPSSSSNPPTRPPVPRKKRLQRQKTLNEESRPEHPENPQIGPSDSVLTTGSSEYVTASTSLSESGSGTQGYASDTLRDVLSLSVVDEISETGAGIGVL